MESQLDKIKQRTRNIKRQQTKRKKRLKDFREQLIKSPNGQLVRDFMVSNKVVGDYRNYVVISGDIVTDYKKKFTLSVTGDDGTKKSFGVEGIALVHKSRLRFVIGKESAAEFWHQIFGRR